MPSRLHLPCPHLISANVTASKLMFSLSLFFFLHPTESSLVLLRYIHGYGPVYWRMSNLPVATSSKKNCLLPPRSHEMQIAGPYEPLLIHTGILTGLILCRSYAGYHICCQLMRSTDMPHLRVIFFYSSPSYPSACNFFLSNLPPSPDLLI